MMKLFRLTVIAFVAQFVFLSAHAADIDNDITIRVIEDLDLDERSIRFLDLPDAASQTIRDRQERRRQGASRDRGTGGRFSESDSGRENNRGPGSERDFGERGGNFDRDSGAERDQANRFDGASDFRGDFEAPDREFESSPGDFDRETNFDREPDFDRGPADFDRDFRDRDEAFRGSHGFGNN